MAKKTRKKVEKQEAQNAPEIKRLYRIERENGGWILVHVDMNEEGKVVGMGKSVEDVLPNILYKLEKAIRDEFQI